jgi:hypothetical protein
MVSKLMPERHVALHRSGSAKPPRRRAGLLKISQRVAEALGSRPRAAKVVPGWLLGAAPSVKSRRRQIVNPDIGLAVRMRRARMQTSAPGADVARCMFMILDDAILQGRPRFPHDLMEVSGVIKEHHVRFVHIDPRVSSVSGGFRLQNTQDARRAIDPLLSMARASHCSVLAVARPNRGEGDLRARVGLSSAETGGQVAAVRDRTARR